MPNTTDTPGRTTVRAMIEGMAKYPLDALVEWAKTVADGMWFEKQPVSLFNCNRCPEGAKAHWDTRPLPFFKSQHQADGSILVHVLVKEYQCPRHRTRTVAPKTAVASAA